MSPPWHAALVCTIGNRQISADACLPGRWEGLKIEKKFFPRGYAPPDPA